MMKLGLGIGFIALIFSGLARADDAGCAPFLDQKNNPVATRVTTNYAAGQWQMAETDATPAPPALTPFGQAVLQVCGALGSPVSPKNVTLLLGKLPPEMVAVLRKEFKGQPDDKIMAALTRIWMESDGFQHIFCGETDKPDRIGGMHFWGRYYQLQQAGQICRLANNEGNEEIFPGRVYTQGVKTASGIIDRKKGFSPLQNAEDIFFEATMTFLRNCTGPKVLGSKKVCTSAFYKDRSFVNLFVCAGESSIITFYPMAMAPADVEACL